MSDIKIPDGLSEIEKKNFIDEVAPTPIKSKTEDEKSQTVSRVKYDQDIDELKQKILKKEKKIDELNKDRESLRKERDTFKSRWEKAKTELDGEQKKSNELTEQLRKANNDVESLKNDVRYLTEQQTNVQPSEDINEIKKELKKAKKENTELNGKIEELNDMISNLNANIDLKGSAIEQLCSAVEGFEAEKERLNDTISLKNREIEGLKKVSSEHSDVRPSAFLIRQDADVIESELLDDGNYEVKLARNGRYMLIVPDIEGPAVCKNHKIILPRLGKLIPFSKRTEYPLTNMGNSIFRVELK